MSVPKYWTMLTPAGRAKVKNAIGTGIKIDIKKFAVGDGNILPNAEGLTNEVFSGLINSSVGVEDNDALVEVIGIIPAGEGGFYVREAAFYTEDDEAFVVIKYPETFKPSIADNASAELGIKAVIDVVQADVVNLKIDPSMIYATQQWVTNEINKFVRMFSLDEYVAANTDAITTCDKLHIFTAHADLQIPDDAGTSFRFVVDDSVNLDAGKCRILAPVGNKISVKGTMADVVNIKNSAVIHNAIKVNGVWKV